MNEPTLITLDPLRLRDQLQSDPQLRGLLEQGYHVASTVVLVEGSEENLVNRLGLVLVPPSSHDKASTPRWLPWCLGAVLALLAGQLGLLVALLAQHG